MPPLDKAAKKAAYFSKLIELIETHPNVLIVHADFVGSKQLQGIRIELRGRAVVLMGKNTMIRTCLRQNKDKYPDLGLDKLVNVVKGNIGFIFCIAPVDEVREVISKAVVPAAAKAGVISPIDVHIPAGACGLDPSNTNFFQALNIATKIVKGQIELLTEVKLLKVGVKVTLSEQVLLQKLNYKPFFYGLELLQVYQNGSVFDASVLDITDEILMAKWASGVANMAGLSRQIGVPTAASLPHAIAAGFKNIAALVSDLDYNFKEIETIKEYLADPSKFAFAAAAAAPAAGGAGAAVAAAPVVEEEEEEEDMEFDLFG